MACPAPLAQTSQARGTNAPEGARGPRDQPNARAACGRRARAIPARTGDGAGQDPQTSLSHRGLSTGSCTGCAPGRHGGICLRVSVHGRPKRRNEVGRTSNALKNFRAVATSSANASTSSTAPSPSPRSGSGSARDPRLASRPSPQPTAVARGRRRESRFWSKDLGSRRGTTHGRPGRVAAR